MAPKCAQPLENSIAQSETADPIDQKVKEKIFIPRPWLRIKRHYLTQTHVCKEVQGRCHAATIGLHDRLGDGFGRRSQTSERLMIDIT